MSFYAKMKADGGTLLGGVLETQSSRFETAEQAGRWLDQGISVNRDAGRSLALSAIFESPLIPEIYRD